MSTGDPLRPPAPPQGDNSGPPLSPPSVPSDPPDDRHPDIDSQHPESFVGPEQIRSRFEQPGASFATLSRWSQSLLRFLDPDDDTLHMLNATGHGRSTASWMAKIIPPGEVWRRYGTALSNLHDHAQWHQNRRGGPPVPSLPPETVSRVEAIRFVCDLRQRFNEWAATPANCGKNQPVPLEQDEEPGSEAPKDWATMGVSKQAILIVLNRATERMNGPALAGKTGYSAGSLRHHYGALQRWGYIDWAKGGYAITPAGSAVMPCEPV
jgi:biotin operon repressor